MTSNSARKLQALFLGVAAIVSICMAANILALSWPTLSLPLSDCEAIFMRYRDFLEGKMSLFSFIFLKHGEHNHASVFLLGLIDIYVDDGKLHLLHWTQIASHIIVYGLMLYAAFKLVRPIGTRGVLLLFISSQMFAIQGAETWVFPFQVVLASFYLFFIAGLILFCREVASAQPPRYKVLSVSLLLLLVAALSHGSGVVIFALLFVLAGIWGGRKVVYTLLPFFLIFVLHEIVYQETPLTELLLRIPISELFNSPYYLALLLGNFFAWGASAGIKVAVGITGIFLWIILLVHILKNRKQVTGYTLFFIALSTFSLAGAGLSVLMNLTFMDSRFGGLPAIEFFLSSRYLIITSGFWIGIASAGLMRVTSEKQMLLSICLICSSAAAVLQGENQKQGWQDFFTNQEAAERLISTDTWKELPQEAVSERLLLMPHGFPFERVALVLDIQKQLGLGVYARNLFDAVRDIPPEHTETKYVQCEGHIDTVAGVSSPSRSVDVSGVFPVRGWLAHSTQAGELYDKTFLTITDDKGNTSFISTRKQTRGDVADAFHKESLSNAGYEALVDSSAFNGKSKLGLAALKDSVLYRCEQLEVDLNPAQTPLETEVKTREPFVDAVNGSLPKHTEIKNVQCEGRIDTVAGVSSPSQTVDVSGVFPVRGWLAHSTQAGELYDKTFLTITDDKGNTSFISTQKETRGDVAAVFHKENLANAGYEAQVDSSAFNGKAKLGLAALKDSVLYKCEQLELDLIPTQ